MTTHRFHFDQRIGYKMIRKLSILFFIAATFVSSATYSKSTSFLNNASVETYFSPKGGASDALASLIAAAQTRVWIAGYGFTSTAISEAARKAQRRGVDVRLVLDKSNRTSRHSQAPLLKRSGVDVRTNGHYAIMHHKFIIVDDAIALGSMNFTDSGELRNAENMNIFLAAKPLADVYAIEFLRLYQQSNALFDDSIEERRAERTEMAAEAEKPKSAPSATLPFNAI